MEIYNLLKDFASPTIAGIGVYIAWYGLNTWRRQLTGQVEHELARKLLISVKRTYREFYIALSPMVWEYEHVYPQGDEAESMSPEKYRNEGFNNALIKRWDRLVLEFRELDDLTIEAEVFWSDLLNEDFKAIREAIMTANYTLQSWIHNGRSGMHPYMNENEAQAKLKSSVDNIENFLRPKIKSIIPENEL